MSKTKSEKVLEVLYECYSEDIHSESFKVEFKLRVEKLLHNVKKEEKQKCSWCGVDNGKHVSAHHHHAECYEGILQGEGIV